jgi:hypothetical protein
MSLPPRGGHSAMTTTHTHTLETVEADIAYDVHGPLPTADGSPLLFMIGQPMTAGGFDTLASHFPDRTVVTYDPVIEALGAGRSRRIRGQRVERRHGGIHRDDVVARRIHGRILRPARARSRRVRDVDRRRRLPGRPAAIRPFLGGQRLSTRRRRAGRGADSRRDRRRRGVPGRLHRAHVVGNR